MDLLKYFYEEPAALWGVPETEADRPPALGSLDALLGGPTFYRGYLAGTSLEVNARRVGATALADPGIWTRPLLALWPEATWAMHTTERGTLVLSEPEAVLRDPSGIAVLAVASGPVGDERLAALAGDRRETAKALRALLSEVHAVLFPEPAHDGFDWSLWSAAPLQVSLVEALRQHPAPGARRFVLPYQRARGEHRFYFEQWQLDNLPGWVEEV